MLFVCRDKFTVPVVIGTKLYVQLKIKLSPKSMRNLTACNVRVD